MAKEGKVILKNDYERMVSEFNKATLTYTEHMMRYFATQKLVYSKTVLDIASGSGYGAQLIAKQAKKVFGVDIKKVVIKYAQERFPGKNIEYKVDDGDLIPLEDNSFNLVLHSETLENVSNPAQVMDACRRVLKDGSIVLFTVPILWGRIARRRTKIEESSTTNDLLPSSYHGHMTNDYLVFFEYAVILTRFSMLAFAILILAIKTMFFVRIKTESNGLVVC